MCLVVNNKKGILVIFSGPSGVGKDSVIKRILEKCPNFELSVSCTTRIPRKGEIHGKDYYFLSKDKFKFVPMQDFSKSWTDEELYKKYNLNEDEIAYIEQIIKPVD